MFQATGIIEPQKVEVPMSGCIMVPTASPQSRSVPMPTYEAPLVNTVFISCTNILYVKIPCLKIVCLREKKIIKLIC